MSFPRYAPTVELPKKAFLPGLGLPRPQELPALADVSLAFWAGVDCYNHHFFWEAHEYWEAIWRETTPGPYYWFLKGIIQHAAAGVHLARGVPSSCRRLGYRGLASLGKVASQCRCYQGVILELYLKRWWRFLSTPEMTVKYMPRLVFSLSEKDRFTHLL